MNFKSESGNMSATSLEALIQANGQAVETRQRIPYEMVVYAIPEEWREEEMMLLRNAVEFQPTLYGMIDTLATRQELQQIQAHQLHMLREEQQEQTRSIRSILQQDGSVREAFFRTVQNALRQSQNNGSSHRQTGGEDQKAEHPFRGGIYCGLGAGLRGLASAGRLIEDDSEDPEERRRRIEAEQAASNAGVLLGLAIGTTIALNKTEEQTIREEQDFNEFLAQMEVEEEEQFQQTM